MGRGAIGCGAIPLRETGGHVRHSSGRATRLFRVDLCRYGIRMTGSWLVCADRAMAAIIGAGRWLVLPVSLLLFLQWPLREVVHGYSAQANDLAQCLFALYVSLALTDATPAGGHAAPGSF